jgi:hypothetical protein
MNLEKLVTTISGYLPNYTVRVYLFASLLIFLIATLIHFLLKKKKQKNKTKYIDLIYGVFFLLLSTSSYFLYETFLRSIFLNNILYIILPPLIFSLISFVKYIFNIVKKKKVIKILNIFAISLFSVLIFLLLTVSLFTVPHISTNSGLDSRRLDSSEEIELSFSSPLKKSDLIINISPDTDFELVYDYFLGIDSLVESVKIVPLESFLPDQKVVIYTTGIQRIFPFGKRHENSQEFFTPKAPEIEEVVLGSDIENVNISDPITLDLDSKDQQFVQWDVVFTPDATYHIERDSTDNVRIYPEKLKQGTAYTLQVYMSVIKYNPLTFQKISTQSQSLVKELTFKTAPAPGVKQYNRSSGFLPNSDPLLIEFDTPIKEESLNGKFSIKPEIEGSISLLEEGKTLQFKPTETFEKNTKYEVVLSAGIENIHDGYIEQDIVLPFETPGYVTLLYANPRNYSTNISITTKSISLTFNQPVNKESVQSKFSISPSVTGSFSWNGNTIYYTFSKNLSYGTKYTVTLKSGIESLYGLTSAKDIYTSFTTKYQSVILNVPQYFQGESFTCNLAATRMVLGYKGISSSEESMRNAIGIGQDPNSDWVDKYGVHWGPISSYISSRGVSNSVQSGMSLTTALEHVKSGRPILLYVYNGYTQPKGAFTLEGGYTGYKGMHSEVLVGYVGTPQNPQTIITLDPWRGKRYYYPSTFKGLWSYLGYVGIVIY